MNIGTLFDAVLVHPMLNILVGIYHVLSWAGVPYSLGFSIIVLTIIIRLLLHPLTISQLRISKKMQALSPHLSKVKEKHKNDATRLQQETMKLYKEHGVNPAAGCLPTLLQLPIIWALYSVLQQIIGGNQTAVLAKINAAMYIDALQLTRSWDQHFFGMPLGLTPAQVTSSMPFLLLVPVATGVLQFIQSKMMFPKQEKQDAPKEKKTQDDFASAFQTQSLYIFPVMIGFFSYNFPIGLSLYWNTFTIFGILQQHHVNQK